MRVAVFVDGANYTFMQKNLGWHIDAAKLLDYCERFGTIEDAYYYTGVDSSSDVQQGYLTALTHIGYALVTKPVKTIGDSDTGSSMQKANLDIEIVLDMFTTIDTYDMAVLVSGDGDFRRVLELLRARGKKFTVIATSDLVAREIRSVCGMHYIGFEDIRDEIEKF